MAYAAPYVAGASADSQRRARFVREAKKRARMYKIREAMERKRKDVRL